MSPSTSTPSVSKQGVLRARIDPEIEQAFVALAKQRGVKTSDLLRSLVLAELGRIGPPVGHIQPDAENAEVGVMKIRLPAFLFDAIKSRADMRGMPPARWAAALIQSNLSRYPVINEAEVDALKENSRQLQMVGHNINQIAKTLNDAFYKTESVRLETLAELRSVIMRSRRVISALVGVSRKGWEVSDS